jgi:hypothetical protein
MSQHHDPVHPDAGHLTAEMLADLDLGLLDEESADHATAHLEHCAICRELHAHLAAVTDSLHGLSEQRTEPMPDDVWDRISEVLATQPVITPQGSASVVPLDAKRKRRLGRPGIGVVAGIAGVALLGAIVVPAFMSNSGSNSASDSTAGGAAEDARPLSPADFQATRSGTQYKQDELDQQVTRLVAERQDLLYATADSSVVGGADASDGPSPSTSVSVGTTATPEPSGPASSPGSGLSHSAANLLRTAGPMATSPAAAQACLANYLNVTGVAPLAVDIGLWQGKPAAVIVLPLDDPTLVQVWVIDPTCDASSAQDPLYYYATIRR